MTAMFIRKFIPRSLLARFLLIIITPTVLMQLIATYVFYQRHWSSVTGHMAAALAGQVAMLTHVTRYETPKMQQTIRGLVQDYSDIRSTVIASDTAPVTTLPLPDELAALSQELSSKVFVPFAISYLNNKSDVQVDVFIKDKAEILRIIASRKRLDNPTTTIFILWMTGTATLLMIVAILFLRNQIRSISRLAVAAEKFGKGQEIKGFKPEGAEEVRKAARAFLKMKERIERQIAQRTEMLAGVSHDLRTPLTRMKLQLAMLPRDSEMQDMQSDILEMERMIHDYLEFAKGEGAEPAQMVSLKEQIQLVVGAYRHHLHNISLHIQEDSNIILRCNAFKRALTNILDNAMRYGTQVEVMLARKGDAYAIIHIDDNGVGIAEDKREIVFKPFYRLDSSRNLKTGSVGLGLAIARDIINGHGGDITLSESRAKGLRVTIRMPI